MDSSSPLEPIFFAALELRDEAERRAFLEQACAGDDTLRQQVERMLAAQDEGFLSAPAVLRLDVATPTLIESVGTRVGPYQLLEPIGEGGMGVVFLAEQVEPVQRKVAVKIIRPVILESRQVIARFEAERQTLAMMDHPNIAKVLDAGTTEKGHPYFVMELVQGKPITQYCDEYQLTISDRLALFLLVCQAVQHAHQKGIIHRDLKPTNVLVANYGEQHVPKVIDFGLAKSTTHKLSERTSFTEWGHVMGTIRYMSPEQAEMNSLDIDTRTDIYSLGVILYELLVGSTPLEQDTIKQQALLAILQIIREQEPPPPSERLSDVGQAISGISAQRRIDPAQLSRLLEGDLDWVVMRALEKDRTRRYETAASLADDVRRFLDNEPVQARPPSFAYRLGKLARKHRAAVFASVVVLATLLLGIAATTGLSIWALAERDRADREAREALAEKRRADEKAKEALTEKNRAEAQLARSERLLYVDQITRAQRAWEMNDVAGAWSYLNACQQDLRGWEHDYLRTLFNANHETFRGHRRGVTSVAFSPDGLRVVSGSMDGTLKIWDATNGRETLTLQGHGADVSSVAFSPDGQRIVSGSNDNTLKIWDATRGQEALTLQGHRGHVLSVAFSPDGQRIVSGSDDHTLKIWDATSGQEMLMLQQYTGFVSSVAFSPDGQRIVSGSWDGALKIWDATSGQETLTLHGHRGHVLSVAFSRDGQRIVSGGNDGTLKIWEATREQKMLMLRGHTGFVLSVAFSPDGQRIVSGSDDSTLKIWDATSGQETRTLRGHTGVVLSLAFSPDGQRIVSGSWDGTPKIWDATSGQETLTLRRHTGPVQSVSFSPDGQRIVSGSKDGTLKIWDATSGQEMLTLRGHRYSVLSVAFSPDGQRIVSGSWGDDTLKIWDTTSGQETLTLPGQTGYVTCVAFSPDGQRIVSGSYDDHTLKIWDAASGRATHTLRGHTSTVLSAAFSPDGQRIVSGSGDGTLKIWDASRPRQ